MMKKQRREAMPFKLKLDRYDSKFFNSNIARCEISATDRKSLQSIPELLVEAKGKRAAFLVIKLKNPKRSSVGNIVSPGFKRCGESVDMRLAVASKPKRSTPDRYNVRPARKDDMRAVCDIAKDAFRLSYLYKCGFGKRDAVDRYHAVWVKNLMNDKNTKVFVTEKNKRIAGFLGLWSDKANMCARITLIAVNKRCRGRGIGRVLVSESVEYARGKLKTVFVKTQANNKRAVSLYKKLGFKPVLHDKIFCKKLN